MMYALIAVGVDGLSLLLAHHADGDDAGSPPTIPVPPGLTGCALGEAEMESAASATPDTWIAEFDAVSSKCLDDLGFEAPKEPGLYVWEGVLEWAKVPLGGELDYDPDWEGTFRAPRRVELRRFLSGQPVFADRPAELTGDAALVARIEDLRELVALHEDKPEAAQRLEAYACAPLGVVKLHAVVDALVDYDGYDARAALHTAERAGAPLLTLALARSWAHEAGEREAEHEMQREQAKLFAGELGKAFLSALVTGRDPACRCHLIMTSDSTRHFKGCPLREEQSPALLNLIEALPKCACGAVATRVDCDPHEVDYCDAHAPPASVDLPYAAALRAFRSR